MKDKKLQFLEDRIITEKNETIMMDWEHPLMRRHAEITCQNGGDILEIGFGMGISAQYIQEQDIDSHTIIEIHPEIAKNAREWAKDKENVKIIESDWYDVTDDLKTYDGIFYDAELDFHKDEFYNLVKKILKDGGIYTFFNAHNMGMKNQYNIKENIIYESIDISPPENPYLNSNIYYLPIIKMRL
tara:strand:+ start:202 stop:759 length:558 start_codon:yes stop_codon:yes gene_type:complete